MNVAYQGEPGAFSEEAALALFPAGEPLARRTLRDVFHALVIGEAQAAVAAVENSVAGSINATYDLLRQHDVVIVGEHYLPVSQCLLAPRGTALASVKRVYSHPAALEQCGDYLERLGVEQVAVHDTAGAARELAHSNDAGAAAIASPRAAGLYGLDILARDIQDTRDNTTRFLALAREPRPREAGRHKTAIVMATDDRPGALHRALGALASEGVNLFKLESRPSRLRAFESVFYLDLDGHRDDAPVRAALANLARVTTFVKVLGSFPAAERPK
ncbi:MAG: prephenate dehydratase [Thermoplasmatota archaeon]